MQGRAPLCLHRHVALGHGLALHVHAGCQQTARTRLHCGLCALRHHVQLRLRGDAAAVLDAPLGLDAQIALRMHHAAVAQPAVALQRQRPGAGLHDPGVVHAQAVFCAHEENFAGIHAAQLLDVQREHRLCAVCGSVFAGRDHEFCGIGLYLVVARDHLEVLRPQLGVHLDSLAQDARVVGIARVQPFAFNGDLALVDLVREQTVCAHRHLASAQRDLTGIDEFAAVDHDAAGVGHDHLGSLARHFHRALNLAGVFGVDFGQNHFGNAPCQPRVGLHRTHELAGRCGPAVVEDHACSANIELAEAVARDPCAAGGLDVDLHHTVHWLQDGRLLDRHGLAVGHDACAKGLCLHHWKTQACAASPDGGTLTHPLDGFAQGPHGLACIVLACKV